MATQKVALITAGTAGLGAAIARVLAPDFRVVRSFQAFQQHTQANFLAGNQLRKQQLSRRRRPQRTPRHPQHRPFYSHPSLPRHKSRHRRPHRHQLSRPRNPQHHGTPRRRNLKRRLHTPNQLHGFLRTAFRRRLGQMLPLQCKSTYVVSLRMSRTPGC
jgi:hypothetical protein